MHRDSSKKAVIKDITQRNVELVAEMEHAAEAGRTIGEIVADLVARGVGSWTFLITQSVILIMWMTLNFYGVWMRWDPYPFILLNLVLSFQAAFATPIILMSQNRQGRLNDRRNHLDLQVNLLAEQENTEQLRLLRMICEKLEIPFNREEEQVFEEAIQPTEIVEQITATVESTHDQAALDAEVTHRQEY
jgi:uncharacterized membrane protein